MSDNKINNAGYRFIELVKELVKRPLSIDEMLAIVEETADNSYRKELINKYINTLKLLNVPIVKLKDKYYIQRSLESTNYETSDLSVIKFMNESLNNIDALQFKDNLKEALQVVEKSFSDDTYNLIKTKKIKTYPSTINITKKDENVELYEKYCREKYKLNLQYKNDLTGKTEKYNVAPLKIIYKKGNAVLLGYCYGTCSYKEFLLCNILKSEQMPQVSTVNLSGAVTFKLKGRLASSYKLKEGETVLEMGVDYKVISNTLEDKDLILKRLIRYFDSCEILYPKQMKEKMLNLINEMESIYV